MTTFKDFYKFNILEAIDPEKYLDEQNKSVDLFFGRMQPLHKGHQAIINSMKNPVVVLIKGKKSSADKSRNPFNEKEQERWIKKVNPKVKVITYPTGYIPDIVNELRKEGLEVNNIYAGEDRINSYKKQIIGFNKQIPDEKKINVGIIKTPRITSATDVRQALIDNNIDKFKENMPKELWSEFDYMKNKIEVK